MKCNEEASEEQRNHLERWVNFALRRLMPVVQLFVSHICFGPDASALVLNSFHYTQALLRYIVSLQSGHCLGHCRVGVRVLIAFALYVFHDASILRVLSAADNDTTSG